jgi:hypothetical protein
LARIAAWGQMSAHLLHWMQIAGSQTGMSRAIARFSQRLVPVGQVPSTGNALTGSRSPLPAIIKAVTRFTKSGASSATRGGRTRVVVAAFGTATGCRFFRVSSTAAKLRRTISAPFLPYVFSIACLIFAIASSRGSTPDIAKKQVCMMALTRPPMPVSLATW